MSGMWPMIGLTVMLLAAVTGLVILGAAVVHVSYRWWLMLMCGMDWDDAGTLIRAKYRRRHGVHAATDDIPPAGFRQVPPTGTVRVVPAHAGPGELARRVQVTGNPPWAGDDTHVLPTVSNTETETWLAPGGGLDQTVQMRQRGARRD